MPYVAAILECEQPISLVPSIVTLVVSLRLGLNFDCDCVAVSMIDARLVLSRSDSHTPLSVSPPSLKEVNDQTLSHGFCRVVAAVLG